MKNMRITAILLAAAMVFSLTACGKSTTTSSSGSTAATKEKVVLNFYDWTDEQTYLDPAVKAYNEQSKVAQVKVTYFPATEYAEKILSAFSSQTKFDVLGVNGVSPYGQYQDKKTLVDISKYVKDSKLDTSVYGSVFQQCNANGIFGLPYRQSDWLIFANKKLFKDAGIEIPTKQLTWDEYRELAKKLTKGTGDKKTYGGLVGMDNWVIMQQLGGSVMDKDTTIIRKALQTWKQLEDDGSHVPFKEKLEMGQNAGTLFSTAPATKVAMFQNGTWGVAALNTKVAKGELPFDYAVMPMPIPEGSKEYTSPCGMNFFSIPKSSEHPAEAYDFIQYMTTAKGAGIIAESGTLTAYNDADIKATFIKAVKQSDDTLSKIVFSQNNQIEQKYDPNYAEVETALKEEFQLYMIGEQDIDATMKKFESRRAEIVNK